MTDDDGDDDDDNNNNDYTLSVDFSAKFLGTSQDQHLRVMRCQIFLLDQSDVKTNTCSC